jgi:hypothetical protein
MFLFLFFLFCKIGEQEDGTGLAQWGGLAPVGRGKVAGKGGRSVSMIEKMCTHACKCNNDTCCNYSMNGQWRGCIGEW